MTDTGQTKQRFSDAVMEFGTFIDEPPSYEEMKRVREYRHELAPKWLKVLAEIEASLSREAALREALERSVTAINDWLHVYAAEHCNEVDIKETQARLSEYGTISYIANVQEQNSAALKLAKSPAA